MSRDVGDPVVQAGTKVVKAQQLPSLLQLL